MSRIPETFTQSYANFCKRALLEYDTLQQVSKTPVPSKYKKATGQAHKATVDRTVFAFELVDLHTSKQGGKTFESPWKPGNMRYAFATPPLQLV